MVTWYIDDSELVALEIDLAGAPMRIQQKAPAALRRQIGPYLEAQQKIDATGHMGNWFGIPGTSYVTPLPRAISHEMIDSWTVESGFEPKGVGKLAPIIVMGSPRNAPAYDFYAALRRTVPFALHALGVAAEESVLG